MPDPKADEPLELRPKSRVRAETWRMLFRGLKALIDEGCVINAVTIIPGDVKDAARRRSVRIGKRRPSGADKLTRAPELPGRPPVRKRKKGETDDDKRRRLARERQAKKRQRDRQKKGRR